MRSKTDRFLINDQPLLAPDGEVTVSYEDLDGSDAGTMIVGVKCAMIYDVEDNDAPFQKAKVVCR